MSNIEEIKSYLHSLEVSNKRTDVFRYLKRQWQSKVRNDDLCILIINQMMYYLDAIEYPDVIWEEQNEHLKYYFFLQTMLIYANKHLSYNKIYLWYICYYLNSFGTYHNIFGLIFDISKADTLKRDYFLRSIKLFNSSLFRVIPLLQGYSITKSNLNQISSRDIYTELSDFHFGENEVDQEFLGLFEDLLSKSCLYGVTER